MAYGSYAGVYYDAGWRCILPVPAETKTPPPGGYTGDHGLDEVPPEKLAEWEQTHYYDSIALRLPYGVIAIDIDHYDKVKTLPDGSTQIVAKRGDDTIRATEQQWGVLPPTWASTARGSETGTGASRTLFYRCPAQRYASTLGDAVEILQRHHRYCVVWPSTNPDFGGALYRWYDPSNRVSETVPHVDQLAELPPRWVVGLAQGAGVGTARPAAPGDGTTMLGAILADVREECAEVTDAKLSAISEFEGASAGSRHDIATGRVYQLIRLAAFGHTGAGEVLAELYERWQTLTAGEDREDEWERICHSAACKAVTEAGRSTPVPRDPCLMFTQWGPPVPHIPDPDTADPDGPDVPQLDIPAPAGVLSWSRRELIGAQAFDPNCGRDQPLAKAVLERVHPVLRYATDAGVWILRGPHAWDVCTDMAEWAVSEVAELMPHGSEPETKEDKNTPEARRFARRARFESNGTANAIAGKMRSLVRAPGHPATVVLADLDTDPEILWAGGLPWDLRNCAERPAVAVLDIGTPHLVSAGVAPSGLGLAHPTPLWDAYTAAIWPDSEIREYALRVLAIGLTGYPEAALPILLGDTGRGKTSIVSLIMSLLGTYAHAADPRLLTNADNSHASIVYALKGRRWSFIDEGPKEGKTSIARLKQLTGGAELTGNAMRTNPITFRPTHTLVLTANPEETPTFSDPALRRRVRLLPCDGDPQAVATTRGAITTAAWQREAPGVLAQMMHRASLWLNDRSVASRMAAPERIRYQVEEIASEQDVLKAWIEAEMEPSTEGTRATELLGWYADWLRRLSLRPPTPTLFGRKLTELGYPVIDDRTDDRRAGKFRPLRRRTTPSMGPHVPPMAPQTAPPYGGEPGTGTTQPPAWAGPTPSVPPTAGPEAGPEVRHHPIGEEHSIGEVPQMRNGTSTPPASGSADAEMAGTFENPLPALSTDSDENRASDHERPNASTVDDPVPGMSDLLEHTDRTDVPLTRTDVQPDSETILRRVSDSGQPGANPAQNPAQTFSQVEPSIFDGCDGLSGSTDYMQLMEKTPIDQQKNAIDANRQFSRTRRSRTSATPSTSGDAVHRVVAPGSDDGQPGARSNWENRRLVWTGELAAAQVPLNRLRHQRNELAKRLKRKTLEPAERTELIAQRTEVLAQIDRAEQGVKGIKAQIAAAVREIKKCDKATEAVNYRRQRIAELAGPVLGLPAVKIRGKHPAPVSLERAAELVREAMHRRAAINGGVIRLTVDIESTGYPIGHPDHAVRTVQLGDWLTGVVFDVADPVQFAVAMLLLAEATELEAYSAAVEISQLAHIGMIDYESGWKRVHDVVIPAQLDNPVGTQSDAAGLKQMEAKWLGEHAVTAHADDQRKKLFSVAGWKTEIKQKNASGDEGGWHPISESGWAQVDPGCATMVDYAASDVLGTAALAMALPRLPTRIYERERAIQAAVGAVSLIGIKLDPDNITRLLAVHEPRKAQAEIELAAYGITNPGSGDQIATALIERGARLPLSEKTGKPLANKNVIKHIEAPAGSELAALTDAILRYRHHAKAVSTYLKPYDLLCKYGDGRMRSTIYTLSADTGRMCVPTTHRILTTAGYISVDDVVPGMQTLDAQGRWVRVTAVHRYDDAPLLTISRRGIELDATPEHRWVTSLPHATDCPRELRRLTERPNLRIHLAPDGQPFDFDAREIPARSESERFAALVGMMVTDGRCTEGRWVPGGRANGLRAYVYQTERKFYKEFLRVIPSDAIMYDRITDGKDHHEIRINARWLRPRLAMAGLVSGALLKNSDSLYAWIVRLPLSELRAFFAACWLSDGNHGQRRMSCGSASLRRVLTLAAYRLGLLTTSYIDAPGEWSTRSRYGLSFREAIMRTGTMLGNTLDRGRRSDVWCVSTETGTWTAVHPDGVLYLTGNSCVHENLQNIPRIGGFRESFITDDGELFVDCDLSGVEVAVLAALSQDPVLLDIVASGKKLHKIIAELVYGPHYTNEQYNYIKNGVFAKLYGAGIPRIADTVGCTEIEAQKMVDALDQVAPGARAWGYEMQHRARAGMHSVELYSGRVLHLPRDNYGNIIAHKIVNYLVQGSAREVFADGLLRWRDTRWARRRGSLLVPVHDEMLATAPAAEAPEAQLVLAQCMSTELYGVRIGAEPKWEAPSPVWLGNDAPKVAT
jgi:P4 family phage/plasmid primase-like protien